MRSLKLCRALMLLSISLSLPGGANGSVVDHLFRWYSAEEEAFASNGISPRSALASLLNDTNSTTQSPTTAPPSNHTHNETTPPHPSNHSSISPTPAAHNGTAVPHNTTTVPPSPSNHTLPPIPSNYTTNQPTFAPTAAHHNNTNGSSMAPSAAPDDVAPRMSFWGIIRKTIAWMILIALSVLGFGACMSHRYRIYFFLRGVWYTIRRMQCTQWIFRKLRIFGGDQQVDSGLNTIIFDSEMSEGLLLNENNRDE